MALAPGEHLKVPRARLTAGIAFGLLAAFGPGFSAEMLLVQWT